MIEDAQAIMDNNFLGPEEITEDSDIKFNQEELTKLVKIPFGKETLQKYNVTHILFPGIDHNKEGEPLTIMRLMEMPFNNGYPMFCSYRPCWFDDKKFATRETPEPRWYLMKKSIIKESKDKTYKEKEEFLKENREIERAVVYIYAMSLMLKLRREWLFKKGLVLCKDVFSDGEDLCHVYISRFFELSHGQTIMISSDWRGFDGQGIGLGIVPSQKFD